MGEAIRAHCEHCGYSQTFNIGSGLKSIVFSYILQSVDDSLKQKLLQLQETGVQNLYLMYALHNCSSCNELFSVPVITYNENAVEKHIYGSCPKCNTIVSSLKGNYEEYYCPKCRGLLSISSIGLWD